MQDIIRDLLIKIEGTYHGHHDSVMVSVWNEPEVSLLEAVLSRGDRRLGEVIYKAWEAGNRFDAWQECFNHGNWLKSFQENGLEPAFYANRERPLEEILPWQHIDTGVTQNFLKKEYKGMRLGKNTPDCRHGACNACGLQRWHPDCRQKSKTKVKLI